MILITKCPCTNCTKIPSPYGPPDECKRKEESEQWLQENLYTYMTGFNIFGVKFIE